MRKEEIGYGLWDSPITPRSLIEEAGSIVDILVDQNRLYWLEKRPSEKGRIVLVSHTGEFSPPHTNIRSKVHEYGGKAALLHKGILYFVNDKDQALYRCTKQGEVEFVAGGEGLRFADLEFHPNGRWLYAIMEEHSPSREASNGIVKIEISTGKIEEISLQKRDFFAYPRISPDGKKMAYIVWDHPNMPWDQTELFVASLDDKGNIEEELKFSGGLDESIVEPTWSPKGELYFISDRSGFWNLYNGAKEGLCVEKCDYTRPLWNLGMRRFIFGKSEEKEYIAALCTKKGIDHLVIIDPVAKTKKEIALPFTSIDAIIGNGEEEIYLLGGSPEVSGEILKYNVATKMVGKEKRCEQNLLSDYIAIPELIEFPTSGGDVAYGIYYPPTHPKHAKGSQGEKPPLIVFVHGGPTAHVQPLFNKKILFWTTRGFAVCDLNYRGSSGYGRHYRDRLKGKWGEYDVDDAVYLVDYLGRQGKIDPKRVAIRGSSAGGYTVLAALAFRKTFKAGISYYGVSDLEALVQESHKFEKGYIESLVGPYPKEKEKYHARSPLHQADKISAPVLFLQGEEDTIVPPIQSASMHKALLEKGIPALYILFPGEGHSFKKGATLAKALENELAFLSKVLIG